MNLYEMFEETRELTFMDALTAFLPLAMDHLGLEKLPTIHLRKDLKTQHLPSFGQFSNDDNVINVDIENRHPNDVLRTLAHELTHFSQNIRHGLGPQSWRTGSPDEDEANAEAGVIMRKFNQTHPEFMRLKPIMLSEKWSKKYKRSIDCSNPKGFSQRAHCQGRKKHNEDTCQTHKSPSGRMTNMCPDDDDYEINYGKQNEAVEPDEPGYQHDILTMPQNTLVIDTPGELDWYKIGQHFPNLGKEDPHEYGQSESDMVMSFATPEEMAKFIQVANRLGLKVKSIGGSQEHPEIHAEPKMEDVANSVEIVHEPSGRGHYIEARIDGREVGRVWFNPTEGGYKASMAWVSKDLRRQGIARKMYQYARDTLGLDIVPSDVQSDDAKAFWATNPVEENFADGKKPGRKGLAKRSGVNCKASVTQLRKVAKNSTGEKRRMAHWCANMKSGRNK